MIHICSSQMNSPALGDIFLFVNRRCTMDVESMHRWCSRLDDWVVRVQDPGVQYLGDADQTERHYFLLKRMLSATKTINRTINQCQLTRRWIISALNYAQEGAVFAHKKQQEVAKVAQKNYPFYRAGDSNLIQVDAE